MERWLPNRIFLFMRAILSSFVQPQTGDLGTREGDENTLCTDQTKIVPQIGAYLKRNTCEKYEKKKVS